MTGRTYFLEKASPLVRNLLVGQGTSKQRLRDCKIEMLLLLSSLDSEDINEQKRQIVDRLNVKKDPLLYMRNAMASKIIGDFFDLYNDLKLLEPVKGQQIK